MKETVIYIFMIIKKMETYELKPIVNDCKIRLSNNLSSDIKVDVQLFYVSNKINDTSQKNKINCYFPLKIKLNVHLLENNETVNLDIRAITSCNNMIFNKDKYVSSDISISSIDIIDSSHNLTELNVHNPNISKFLMNLHKDVKVALDFELIKEQDDEFCPAN